jgi:hypothetical protein
MKANWTEATQARRATSAARHRRPATARLIRTCTYTRAVTHDRRGRGDGGGILQRARAIARGVPGTPEPANAEGMRNGQKDRETALPVALSRYGPEALPLVDDRPAECLAKRTEGADPDAISLVARACVKGRGWSKAEDPIVAGRQRHGELARV